MKKSIFFVVLMVLMQPLNLSAQKTAKDQKQREKANRLRSSVSDSAFTKVYPGNLIEDGTYLKLAREGWTTKQIFAITDDYVAKNRAR